MGQDRQFTEQEKLFALRAVQMYRDRWEESEREDLKRDIDARIVRMEADKIYVAEHAALDQAELESRAELYCQGEALTEEQKATKLKRGRLDALGKCFYDPEGLILHQRQLDRDQIELEDQPKVDKYYPLKPEQWKDAFISFKNY